MTDHPRRADDPHAGRARATPDCDRDDVGPGARTVAPSAAAEGGEWATVVRGEAPAGAAPQNDSDARTRRRGRRSARGCARERGVAAPVARATTVGLEL